MRPSRRRCGARANGWPVVLFTGAHVLKNGFGPLIIDWMRRGVITLHAVNTAGAHVVVPDFSQWQTALDFVFGE